MAGHIYRDAREGCSTYVRVAEEPCRRGYAELEVGDAGKYWRRVQLNEYDTRQFCAELVASTDPPIRVVGGEADNHSALESEDALLAAIREAHVCYWQVGANGTAEEVGSTPLSETYPPLNMDKGTRFFHVNLEIRGRDIIFLSDNGKRVAVDVDNIVCVKEPNDETDEPRTVVATLGNMVAYADVPFDVFLAAKNWLLAELAGD